MTELYPNVDLRESWQRVLKLDPVPELELMALPHPAFDETTTAGPVRVDVEVARVRSATTSSTWSLTATSSSSSTTSARKTAFVAGGGRRHQVSKADKEKTLFPGDIDAPRNQSSTSLPSSFASKSAKIYTPQQLRLLTAEAAPSTFAPGGGRRHHAPRKKPASTKPPKQAKPPKLSWARSPKAKRPNSNQPESAESSQMFHSPLAGVSPGLPLDIRGRMSGDPYHPDSRSSVLQPAPTQFAVVPLAPRKYSSWHYGIRVQVLQRRGSGGSGGSTAQSTSPNSVEYDIWRRWEDCLELQRLIEREYASAATERRVFLAEQNHRINNAGLYQSQRAASFDSLPSGSDPLSISRDVHNHLPVLSKKPKKLRSQPATAINAADEDGTETVGATSGSSGKLTKVKRPSLFKASVGGSNTQALIAQARAEEFAAFLTALFQSQDYLLGYVRGTASFRGWFGWWKRDRDSLERSAKQKSPGASEPAHSTKRGSTSTSSNNGDPHPLSNGKGKEREVPGISTMMNWSSEVEVVAHTQTHSVTSLSSSRAISPNPSFAAPTLPATSNADRPSSDPSSPHNSNHRSSDHTFPSYQQQQINPFSPRSLAPLLTSFPLPQVPRTGGQSSAASATSSTTSGNVTAPSSTPSTTDAPSPSFVRPVASLTPPPIPLHSHPNARVRGAARVPLTRSSSLFEGVEAKRPHTAPVYPNAPSSGLSPESQLPPPSSSSFTSVPVNPSELHPPSLPSHQTATSRPSSAMGLGVETGEIGRNMRMLQHRHRSAARRPSTATGAQPTTVYHPRRQSERLSVSSLKDALAETLGGFPMPPSPLVANMHGRASSSAAERMAEDAEELALEQSQKGSLGRTTPTGTPRREGMGWGSAKSRPMMHLNSGAVTTQNNHSHPRSYATSGPVLSARTTGSIPPESHLYPRDNVHQYASGDDFDGVEDDLMQIVKSSRRAHSQSPRPHLDGQCAIGVGAYDHRAPDLRHRWYQQRPVEPPMLEKTEEDEDEEQYGREDVAVSHAVDVLPEEMDDDDHIDTIRSLSEILLGTLEDPMQSLESLMPPATLQSHQQPTMSLPYMGSYDNEYVDEFGILRNDQSLDRPRGSTNPEHRHARFFREEEKAWDNRFSTTLPKEHHDCEDEEQQHGDKVQTSVTEAGLSSERLAPAAKSSPRLSGDSAEYVEGGGMRISEGTGSVVRDNETISPLHPLRNAHAVTAQHSLRGDEADSLTGADGLESSSRPPSVTAWRPRGLRDGNARHVNQPSFSSVMTNATSSSAQHAPLLSGKGDVYRSPSLILSRSHSMKYTAQTSGPSGSPSLPPSSRTSPSTADKLRRRVSESSIRNTVRKLATLDFFTSTPRTSSPLAMTPLDQSSPPEVTDDSRSSHHRPSSERSSDWARLRSQSPSSFASSSRGEWNGMSRSLSVLDRRVRAESDASERSTFDTVSNLPPEDNSEQDGRHTPASDALAHYFECLSGSDSASMSQNGRLSSEHALAHVSGGSASSSISLGSPLRTPVGDESPIHVSGKAQNPASAVGVASLKASHRDSVTSVASPNQFPRPFQNRPAGQFHLPWASTISVQSRPTMPSSPSLSPTTLITTSVSPTYPTTAVNLNSSQHVSTKVVHAPSSAAVMLRLPRQISLQDLKEKVCAKFRHAADLDLVWDGFLIPTSESDSLLLYYRTSLGSATSPPPPHVLRSRSGSVSSTGTSHDGSPHTFLRITSEDELVHVLGSIPVGEKLVLRLVPSGQEA